MSPLGGYAFEPLGMDLQAQIAKIQDQYTCLLTSQHAEALKLATTAYRVLYDLGFGPVCDGEELSVNGADAVQVICESRWSRICHVAGKPEFVEVDEVGEPVTDETRAAM